MRKFVSLILIACLAFSVMAGCAPTSTQLEADPVSEPTASGTDVTEAASTQESAPEAEKTKIGIVYTTSGRGDMAFNDATYAGAVRAEQELGVTVDNTEPKSLSETEMAIEEMSASGEYALIIGITFEALDAVTRIAPNYPDQKYALVDCDSGLDNVVSYIARENEGAFMGGCLAALLQQYKPNDMITDSKTIGIIGAMDAAVVNRHIAGYISGAKFIDPEMNVLYDYVGGFSDTATGQALSEAMYTKGANIVYNAAAGSGLGMFKASADKGFLAIGLDSNQNTIDPDHIVVSILKNVDEFVYSAISDVVNGTFKGGEAFYLGLAQDGVGYTFEGSNIAVDQKVKDILEDIRQKVISGEIVVPETIDEVDGFVAANHYED